MKTLIIAVLNVLCFFLIARGQVYFGAEVSPAPVSAAPGEKGKKSQISKNYIYSKAFADYFDDKNLFSVFGSTSPEKEIYAYLKNGVYRQELIMLYYMARESSSTFKNLFKDVSDGKTLSYIARKTRTDFRTIFKNAARDKKAIDSLFEVYVSSRARTPAGSKDEEKKKSLREE